MSAFSHQYYTRDYIIRRHTQIYPNRSVVGSYYVSPTTLIREVADELQYPRRPRANARGHSVGGGMHEPPPSLAPRLGFESGVGGVGGEQERD